VLQGQVDGGKAGDEQVEVTPLTSIQQRRIMVTRTAGSGADQETAVGEDGMSTCVTVNCRYCCEFTGTAKVPELARPSGPQPSSLIALKRSWSK
jgi:hypothetical protein